MEAPLLAALQEVCYRQLLNWLWIILKEINDDAT